LQEFFFTRLCHFVGSISSSMLLFFFYRSCQSSKLATIFYHAVVFDRQASTCVALLFRFSEFCCSSFLFHSSCQIQTLTTTCFIRRHFLIGIYLYCNNSFITNCIVSNGLSWEGCCASLVLILCNFVDSILRSLLFFSIAFVIARSLPQLCFTRQHLFIEDRYLCIMFQFLFLNKPICLL
jgi:hypothetical protein